MLIFDLREMGNRLFEIRKRAGLTQAEVAELAGLSDRTYADIERGGVNMRVHTLMQICKSLGITPNDVLTAKNERISADEMISCFEKLSERDKKLLVAMVSVFADIQ